MVLKPACAGSPISSTALVARAEKRHVVSGARKNSSMARREICVHVIFLDTGKMRLGLARVILRPRTGQLGSSTFPGCLEFVLYRRHDKLGTW